MVCDIALTWISLGDLVFDIGANVGEKTGVYLQKGARVVSFEPGSCAYAHLREKYKDNPNVTCVHQGLSDQPGQLSLLLNAQTNRWNTFSKEFTENSRIAGATKWENVETVEVVTLDQAIATYGKPVFCKIDVEGFESFVLRGLTQAVPYLSFEFHQELNVKTIHCIEYLATLGYQKFNVVLGLSQQFVFHDWAPAGTILEYLATSKPGEMLWGDIYCKSDEIRPKNLNLKHLSLTPEEKEFAVEILKEGSAEVVAIQAENGRPTIETLLQQKYNGILLLHGSEADRAACTAHNQGRIKKIAQVENLVEFSFAPFKVEVGSTIHVPGWVPTNINQEHILYLDIRSGENWVKAFEPNSIKTILAEHVIEHLMPQDVKDFFQHAYPFLMPYGTIRIAVPDALHPSAWYHEYCKPGGSGPGSEDHRNFFSCDTIRDFFDPEQYDLYLLEWWDNHGFRRMEWKNDIAHGKIIRCASSPRKEADKTAMIDTTPEHLRHFYDDYQMSYTSLIFDLVKKPLQQPTRLADPQSAIKPAKSSKLFDRSIFARILRKIGVRR